MSAYWCVNFDAVSGLMVYGGEELILSHGLDGENPHWLMQYQYGHGGHEYQHNSQQSSAIINRNWNGAGRIRPGDLLVAYLRGRRFYAIGTAREPRKPKNDIDYLKRTQTEHCHKHLKGIVYYPDAAGALYEDFTDQWIVKGYNYSCRYCLDMCRRWRQENGIDLDVECEPCKRCKFS